MVVAALYLKQSSTESQLDRQYLGTLGMAAILDSGARQTCDIFV